MSQNLKIFDIGNFDFTIEIAHFVFIKKKIIKMQIKMEILEYGPAQTSVQISPPTQRNCFGGHVILIEGGVVLHQE